MSKLIVMLITIMFLVFIFGCAPTMPTEPELEKTTVSEQNEAIEKADKTLGDIEDTETDKELDDLTNVLNQI